MKYGLIGEHLSHSYSKQIHERISDYTYELHPLLPQELRSFVRNSGYSGINVTIPYKKAVIPFLDEISDEAVRIGSVNTVVRRKGRLYGYNTDYYGFMNMAKRVGISFLDRKVLILGTGGTSVTAQTVAADAGAAEIVVVSRNGRVNYENVYNHSDAEIIVNTTPVGMYPENDGSILAPERFPKLYGVLDVVYNPLRTNLILYAHKLGIKTSGGLPMLVYQAIAASELFTEEKVDDILIESVVNEMYQRFQNIILIGMPGSGKTTVGRELAAQMNREFIDIDDCVVKKEGLTIPEIFEQKGEAAFRTLEQACVAEMSEYAGVVIATGGGTVLNPDNMRALMRNGRIYYLTRNIDKLPTDDRPLSFNNRALEMLYHQRHLLYMDYSEACIDCNRTVEHAVQTVKEEFYEAAGY